MDFTLKTYRKLLQSLQNAGFSFITFAEYMESRKSEVGSRENIQSPVSGLRSPDSPHSRFVILRHDVDLLPQNSLAFACIQHEMGIRGSYYFRAVPESWDEDIIKEIHRLGHEVGYHYEDMDGVGSEEFGVKRLESEVRSPKSEDITPHPTNPSLRQAQRPAATGLHNPPNPNRAEGELSEAKPQTPNPARVDLALLSFQRNLEKLRRLVPVKTICMHGSPRSKYDNRDLWKKYDYRDYGIVGEPYFDMDFDDVFYLTDTGRRWDGWKVSVRDKVPQQERWVEQGLVFRSTNDIMNAIKAWKNGQGWRPETGDRRPESAKMQDGGGSKPGNETIKRFNDSTNHYSFPSRLMLTFHPQRWTDKPLPWLKELLLQNLKNVVKGVLVGRGRSKA